MYDIALHVFIHKSISLIASQYGEYYYLKCSLKRTK